MMLNLRRMLRDLVMTRPVKMAPSALTMAMTFSASVAPDIMVHGVNRVSEKKSKKQSVRHHKLDPIDVISRTLLVVYHPHTPLVL